MRLALTARQQQLGWLLVFFAVCGYTALAVVAVRHGNERLAIARQGQAAVEARSDALRLQVMSLEKQNQELRAALAAAVTQANASVGQLTAAGQKPIIAAPGVVTVPTAPGETTTTTPDPRLSPGTTATSASQAPTTATQPRETTTAPIPPPPPGTTTTAPETTTTTTAAAAPPSTTVPPTPIP